MRRLEKLSSELANRRVLILFGAPGVGKGTFASLLRKDLKLNHISTGDEIRKIIKGTSTTKFDPTLISEIRETIKRGKLISDKIVVQIVIEKVRDPDSAEGVILDGFPRTKGQLQEFMKFFPTVNSVVNLTLREDVLIEMLMGRRTCINCGSAFNVRGVDRDGYKIDPIRSKKGGVCDNCGHELTIREDDKEGVIRERIREYEQKTKPLLYEFKKYGSLLNIQCKKGVKNYPELKAAIVDKLK